MSIGGIVVPYIQEYVRKNMNKKKTEDFFDGLAGDWDKRSIVSAERVRDIFKNAGITEGTDVLDVACGTGVLFPFFIEHNVRSITAIDISGSMVEIAGKKFPEKNITVIKGDAESYRFPEHYDCIIIYDAFPHFTDYEKLIENLTAYLKPGGRITIAHSMGRERLKVHHNNVPEGVSQDLPSDRELMELLAPYCEITFFESDESGIQITGLLNKQQCGL